VPTSTVGAATASAHGQLMVGLSAVTLCAALLAVCLWRGKSSRNSNSEVLSGQSLTREAGRTEGQSTEAKAPAGKEPCATSSSFADSHNVRVTSPAAAEGASPQAGKMLALPSTCAPRRHWPCCLPLACTIGPGARRACRCVHSCACTHPCRLLLKTPQDTARSACAGLIQLIAQGETVADTVGLLNRINDVMAGSVDQDLALEPDSVRCGAATLTVALHPALATCSFTVGVLSVTSRKTFGHVALRAAAQAPPATQHCAQTSSATAHLMHSPAGPA
jgi:hypothetical protein